MTKRKDPDEKKVQFNLRIKKRLADRIKEIPNYNPKVENLLENNIHTLENIDKNEKEG